MALAEVVARLVAKPIRRLVAVYFITGHALRALLDEVRRLIVRTLGFMAMRPKGRWLQVRRNHATRGAYSHSKHEPCGAMISFSSKTSYCGGSCEDLCGNGVS